MSDDSTKRRDKNGERGPGRDKPSLEADVDVSAIVPGSSADISRRRFLQATGFTVAGTMVFGCSRAPEQKAVPLLDQPEGMIPGRPAHYATTCGGCSAGCGILATNRDGRPLKLEGNPEHPLSAGGLCAVGQASILGLYDSQRLRDPLIAGKASSWPQVDQEIARKLQQVRAGNGVVRYLSGAITSPTKQAAVTAFLEMFADGQHVVYNPSMDSSILDAHERTHGFRAVPHYHFDRPDVIVSVDADFLGRWISPVEYTRAYFAGRRVDGDKPRFSEHFQFESRMSITGAKADHRFRIAPRERGVILEHLAREIARHARVSFEGAPLQDAGVAHEKIAEVASKLWKHRQRSLVVCGAGDVEAQVLCNFINHMLGNYGNTLDLARPSYQVQGSEADLTALLADINAGRVDALFLDGVNPVLELPGGDKLAARFAGMPLVVSFAARLDETAKHVAYVCPDHHFLESWGDTEAVHGQYSFSQPLVNPLGNTRAAVESLVRWVGGAQSTQELLQSRWGSGARWDSRLHDGFDSVDRAPASVGSFRMGAVQSPRTVPQQSNTELSLVLYSKVGMASAADAFNPWLHEMPDPVTKAVWDNYACLSPKAAQQLGVKDGDVVRLSSSGSQQGNNIELPVLVQPGQHDSVVAVAMGYGSELSRRFAGVGPEWIEKKPTVGPDGLVGASATPLLRMHAGRRQFAGAGISVRPTGQRHDLARSQDYHSIEVPARLAPPETRSRPNIQETTVAAVMHPSADHQSSGHVQHGELWKDDHEYKGHHWGMAIDLSTCTGCAACVVACQVENNVPVVGKDEVRRNREMHWIRIDRYYSGDQSEDGEVDVAFQPMMCHHCDNAPCETVCPVLATVHSDEGLNQQIYNRCVGTRYCSNNCPYKVRRFNWFEYQHEDQHENMVLNPNVTIRSRGVMEKCSLCVQRIQEAKIRSKQRGTPIVDGEIKMACQQSCPADAIAFGDMNDPESAVSKRISSGRHFRVLEEINVRPTVGYMKIVRNRTEEKQSHHG